MWHRDRTDDSSPRQLSCVTHLPTCELGLDVDLEIGSVMKGSAIFNPLFRNSVPVPVAAQLNRRKCYFKDLSRGI